MGRPDEPTRLLSDHTQGDPDSASRLMPMVYDQLRGLAAAYMRRERPDHTLRPTALVHEAYLKLIDNTRIDWQGKAHFFAMAATQMRRILVDHARAHAAEKRGGDLERVTLAEDIGIGPDDAMDVLAVDEALERLQRKSPRQSRVAELRVFAGLEIEEIALALDVSGRTVKRDWQVARAWLRRELSESRTS